MIQDFSIRNMMNHRENLKEVNESPKLMFHKIGTDQSEDYVVYENQTNQDGAGV